MNKKLCTALLLGVAFPASAQIFSSGFENNNGTPLSAYKTVNADGNSVAEWAPVQDFNTKAWLQFYDGFDNKIAFSTSSYDPAGTSNDWLITPAISLPADGAPTAYWKAKSYDETYPDGYKVMVSTTDNAPASFSQLLQIDREQPYEYAVHSLDLSAYKGKTVYIAFVNNTSNGYYLALDDFYISNSASCMMPETEGLAVKNLDRTSFDIAWPATPGISTYDTGLTDFTTPVASTGTQQSTTKSFGGLTAGKRYQFFLKNADCGSGWAGPKSVFTPTNLPYSYGFEATAENYGELDSDGWSSDTWLNGSNPGGANTGQGYIYSNTSTKYQKNDWLYAYPVWLEAGESVKVSGMARMGSDALTEAALSIKVATEPKASANIGSITDVKIKGSAYQEFSGVYKAEAAGVYYFGFGNITPPVPTAGALRLDDIRFEKAAPLGTAETGKVTVQLYPNPVADVLHLKTDAPIENAQVYSADGRLVATAQKSAEIDFSRLPKGVYIVKVRTKTGETTQKVIK